MTGTCPVGSYIRGIAADGTVTCQADGTGPANAFVQGGNAFGGDAVLGTTDNFAVDLRAAGSRVMRYEPNAISPNVVGGHPNNSVGALFHGETVSGGGYDGHELLRSTNRHKYPVLRKSSRGVFRYSRRRRGQSLERKITQPSVVEPKTPRAGVKAPSAGVAGTLPSGFRSTVGGGVVNTASGGWSSVGGGRQYCEPHICHGRRGAGQHRVRIRSLRRWRRGGELWCEL